MVQNKHHVETIAWNSWGSIGQAVFNVLYTDILRNQSQYIHPDTPIVPREQWLTTAWNLAWIAADASHTIQSDIVSNVFEDRDYTPLHDVNLYTYEHVEVP